MNCDVMDQLFDCYSRICQVLGMNFFNQIPKIAQIIQGCASRCVSDCAYLQCSKDIVEVYSTFATQEVVFVFLNELFGCLVGIAKDKLLHGVWDPDAVDIFFQFSHSYLLHCPAVVADNLLLPELAAICVRSLQCSREKNTIKSTLQVIGDFFLPLRRENSVVVQSLLRVIFDMGPDVVLELVLSISGKAPAMLRTSCIDTLLSVFVGCDFAEKSPTFAHWLEAALNHPKVFEPINLAERSAVCSKLIEFAVNNKRLFKAMMLDLSKISAGEQTVDCLGGYFENNLL